MYSLTYRGCSFIIALGKVYVIPLTLESDTKKYTQIPLRVPVRGLYKTQKHASTVETLTCG